MYPKTFAKFGESGESAKTRLANVGESGESAQTRLANAGEFGESEQTRLANVGESGESGTFPKKAILDSNLPKMANFRRVLKFAKLAGEWPLLSNFTSKG